VIKVLRTLNEGGVRDQSYPVSRGVPDFRQKRALQGARLNRRLSARVRRRAQQIRLVVACRRAERHPYSSGEA
jgi:hypothetical protein